MATNPKDKEMLTVWLVEHHFQFSNPTMIVLPHKQNKFFFRGLSVA